MSGHLLVDEVPMLRQLGGDPFARLSLDLEMSDNSLWGCGFSICCHLTDKFADRGEDLLRNRQSKVATQCC